MTQLVDTNIVTACTHDKLSSNTRVINDDRFGHCLYVKLPSDILHNFSIYEITEVDTDDYLDIRFNTKCDKPWLEIDKTYLNTNPGYHSYQIGLVNKLTDDTATLYFGYIIQSNNPDKPYIYMNRDEQA